MQCFARYVARCLSSSVRSISTSRAGVLPRERQRRRAVEFGTGGRDVRVIHAHLSADHHHDVGRD
jgi:hypothetical protein